MDLLYSSLNNISPHSVNYYAISYLSSACRFDINMSASRVSTNEDMDRKGWLASEQYDTILQFNYYRQAHCWEESFKSYDKKNVEDYALLIVRSRRIFNEIQATQKSLGLEESPLITLWKQKLDAAWEAYHAGKNIEMHQILQDYYNNFPPTGLHHLLPELIALMEKYGWVFIKDEIPPRLYHPRYLP